MSVEKQAGVNKFPRNINLFLQIHHAVHLNGMIPLIGRQPKRKLRGSSGICLQRGSSGGGNVVALGSLEH